MDASAWTFEYSPGMPLHPASNTAGWQFAFPTSDGVHYLTTRQAPRSASQFIGATIAVDTIGNPFFEFRTYPDNVCTKPATVRLFFQRLGDTGSGTGEFEFYRWWSNAVEFELGPGSVTMIGDLTDPSQWTSVYGQSGAANVQRYRMALAQLGAVGFTFGGGCFYGHGVYVAPDTGYATFRAREYGIR